MTESVDVKLFFNFRSPYCYIASKTLFAIYDDYHTSDPLELDLTTVWSARAK